MNIRPLLFAGFAFASSCLALHAANFDSATLTFIQHDVAVADLEVMEIGADGKIARRPASLNEAIAQSQAVLTGRKSRAELKFNDGTLARVGQLSSFTYGKGTRLLELKQGSALFVVPKGQGGTTIQAGAVTAAITGTTLLVQVFSDRVLIYVYEGSVDAAGRTIKAGQVLSVPQTGEATLSAFSLARGIRTAALFEKFVEADSQPEVLRQIGLALDAAGQVILPKVDLGENTVVNPRVNTPPPPRPREPDYSYEGGYYYKTTAGSATSAD